MFPLETVMKVQKVKGDKVQALPVTKNLYEEFQISKVAFPLTYYISRL